MFLKGLLLGFGLLVSASASADIASFDFSGPGGNQFYDKLEINSDRLGYTMTVTAQAWVNGQKVDAQVEQFNQGLGVRTLGDNNHRLDRTAELVEQLFFKLTSNRNPDAKFSWTEIFFGSRFSSQLESGEQAQVRFGFPHKANFINGPVDSKAISLVGFSDQIAIQSGSAVGDNGFRVQQIAVDVPAPTTIALLSIGLLGLGARKFVSN